MLIMTIVAFDINLYRLTKFFLLPERPADPDRDLKERVDMPTAKVAGSKIQ